MCRTGSRGKGAEFKMGKGEFTVFHDTESMPWLGIQEMALIHCKMSYKYRSHDLRNPWKLCCSHSEGSGMPREQPCQNVYIYMGCAWSTVTGEVKIGTMS